MNTLDDIKGTCRIEDADSGTPHWIWCGGITRKTPRIWAPDYTATARAFEAAIKAARDDAAIIEAIVQASVPVMASQPGRRAAYHLTTGQALPKGWRVFATCQEDACVAHFGAGPGKEAGRQISKLGKHKHSIRHKLASRAGGRARSKLNLDMIREIQQSNEVGRALAKRLGLSETVISKVRVHGSRSHQPLGGMFSGLMGQSA